jgi:hypothetical protein
MKQTKDAKSAANHPSGKADLDSTETGPSRLYAPGKPRQMESGPSRLQTRVLGPRQTVGTQKFAGIETHAKSSVNTKEAGPARIERYRG